MLDPPKLHGKTLISAPLLLKNQFHIQFGESSTNRQRWSSEPFILHYFDLSKTKELRKRKSFPSGQSSPKFFPIRATSLKFRRSPIRWIKHIIHQVTLIIVIYVNVTGSAFNFHVILKTGYVWVVHFDTKTA